MEENILDLKPARKSFSVLGIAFAVILVASNILQLLLIVGVQALAGALDISADLLSPSSWVYWLVIAVPMYGVAIPLGLLIMKKLPATGPQEHKMGFWKFMSYIPLCFFLVYSGNIVGTILSLLLSGGNAQNGVLDLTMGESLLKVPVLVILAPLIEELLCRKWLIDRTLKYGEKTAVLLSGVCFALLHGNLFQMFYAFLLGVVFAYIYIRTGRLRYSIILHAIVNFCGSVIAPWIISLIDPQSLMNLASIDPNASSEAVMELLMENIGGIIGIIVLYAYLLFMGAVAMCGLVLLIIRWTKLRWEDRENAIPKGSVFKSVYLNAGMISFVIVCAAAVVISLL